MLPEHLQPVLPPPPAGPLDPAFLYADGFTGAQIDYGRACFLPLREAERHRLVEAAKSPTVPKTELQRQKSAFYQRPPHHNSDPILAADAAGAFSDLRDRQSRQQLADVSRTLPTDSAGTQTMIEYREWSEEYRVRTEIAGTTKSTPPEQAGDRQSVMLSERGARKIAESCAYMATKKGGFQTFVTGTFDQAARQRIEAGESTIQREVTRTMDGLQQLYRRGWTTPTGERIDGHGEALPYCWVVEIPSNDQGEQNPHVHMMLGWSVEYRHFKAWAKRIESIWGNGYFHLEKIKDPLCAGAYMAKAAGYLSKAAGQDDQGKVTGNRYAISSTARAPGWETVGAYALGIMGGIIWDLHERLQRKHAALFAERKRLNQARETIRAKAKARQAEHPDNRYPVAAKQALEKIGARLSAVRAKIHRLPVRASKYQLWIKKDAMPRFIGYAHAQGWAFDRRPDSHWLAEYKRRRRLRQRLAGAWRSLCEIAQHLNDKLHYTAEALSAWESYASQGEQPLWQ